MKLRSPNLPSHKPISKQRIEKEIRRAKASFFKAGKQNKNIKLSKNSLVYLPKQKALERFRAIPWLDIEELRDEIGRAL